MSADLLTAEQVAALLDCHVETVEVATRERRLPGLKLGRSWRYPQEALMQVLNAQALASMEAKPARPVLAQPAARRPRRGAIPQLPAAASLSEKS